MEMCPQWGPETKASFIITPSDLCVQYTVLGFANLEELIPFRGRGTLLLEDTARVPLNYMMWLLPGFFRFVMPWTTGKEKSHYILAEIIGSDHGLLLHNGNS